MSSAIRPGVTVIFALSALVLGGVCRVSGAEEPAGQTLKPMLRIEWRSGPEYPMGIEGPGVDMLGGKLICATGFTRHPKDIVESIPEAFKGKPSGFTKLTFLFDPADEKAGWTRIADTPTPRQAPATAVVGDALYLMGGFNYSDPGTYRDVYRLQKRHGKWRWRTLRCDLPWPVCGAGSFVIGSRIYLVGGADYFQPTGANARDFRTEAGRYGDPVGRATLMLDTENLEAGWQRMANLPGVPRWLTGKAVVDGKIYVLGGGMFSPVERGGGPGYYNVVDSWVYDPVTDTWTRLPDMPDGANRSAIAYKDRYVLLVGGYLYPQTWHLDGSRTDARSPEEMNADWKRFFQRTVYVYDTKTGRLGTADPLPAKTNGPSLAIEGDTIYVMDGEGGVDAPDGPRMWHPANLDIGRITELNP